eukprot:scaffold328920_cov52-Tisochrysis_lutea.AAC.4
MSAVDHCAGRDFLSSGAGGASSSLAPMALSRRRLRLCTSIKRSSSSPSCCRTLANGRHAGTSVGTGPAAASAPLAIAGTSGSILDQKSGSSRSTEVPEVSDTNSACAKVDEAPAPLPSPSPAAAATPAVSADTVRVVE